MIKKSNIFFILCFCLFINNYNKKNNENNDNRNNAKKFIISKILKNKLILSLFIIIFGIIIYKILTFKNNDKKMINIEIIPEVNLSAIKKNKDTDYKQIEDIKKEIENKENIKVKEVQKEDTEIAEIEQLREIKTIEKIQIELIRINEVQEKEIDKTDKIDKKLKNIEINETQILETFDEIKIMPEIKIEQPIAESKAQLKNTNENKKNLFSWLIHWMIKQNNNRLSYHINIEQ